MKTHFQGDTTKFMPAKTRRIDAEREKTKRISTLNSSSYVKMHPEIYLEDGPRSAKVI